MTVAQGLNKVTTIAKQVALGTPKTGAGGTVLTRKTSIFTKARDMFESDVITQHQQSTGVAYGAARIAGKLDSLLSTETFQLLFAGLLRKDFMGTGSLTVSTIAASGSTPPAFTDSGNGFLTAGFKVGDVIIATGFTGVSTNSNNRNMLITSLTAGVMTGVFLDPAGAVQVADAAGESVTIITKGKKTLAPVTGHTNDYFSIEEWYANLSKSETFTDCRVHQAAIGLPATGNATASFDFIGLGRTRGTAQVLTGPTEAAFREMSAVNGKIYVNGVAVGNATGLQFTISDGAAMDGPVIGSNNGIDVSRGRIRVSGSFTALFDSTTLQDIYDAESSVSLIAVVTEDETATSAFKAFTMGKIKLTGDAPDDGEKGVVRTYPFTAEYNAAGGAALAWDATIISVQDSQL